MVMLETEQAYQIERILTKVLLLQKIDKELEIGKVTQSSGKLINEQLLPLTNGCQS